MSCQEACRDIQHQRRVMVILTHTPFSLFLLLLLLLQVTEGFDLVEKISKVPTHNDCPKEPIEMLSIRVA